MITVTLTEYTETNNVNLVDGITNKPMHASHIAFYPLTVQSQCKQNLSNVVQLAQLSTLFYSISNHRFSNIHSIR